MLVRKLLVKFALETKQADGPNRAGRMQARSQSVFMCVCEPVQHLSINLFTMCMSVCDFEQTRRLLKLTPHFHSVDLRKKNLPVLLMKELRHQCQGCHYFSKTETPGKRAVINMWQAQTLYQGAGVCTVKVWSMGGISEKKHKGVQVGNYFLFLFSSIASF